MAAYAALVSVMNTMDHIQNNPRLLTTLDNKQIQSLSERINLLLDFVESGSRRVTRIEQQLLESQIASAVCAAEDVIESHIVNQIHSPSISFLDLHTVMQHIDSVVFNVKEVTRSTDLHCKETRSTDPHASTSSRPSKMVGLDDELTRLKDELTGRGRGLQIITIVGMGGIGKTTLIKNVYENLLTSSHFDVRAWATVSQEHSAVEIFSQLLHCKSKSTDAETVQRLGEQLHKVLYNRRYLIVLDDMWGIEAWETIKFFFPDNSNGSRIVVTSRLSSMASHFGSSCLSMKLLDEETSWNLFCENAFPQEEGCPPLLVEIGKTIAEKCKGLSLLIVVLGSLLRKSPPTQEYWENISKDINSVPSLGHDDRQSLDILSLSYSHLPAHLKPCFLYMGIFALFRGCYVRKLIKLWVAEGFIKPNGTQSLEEIALSYVMDLIDRNLFLVHRLGLHGKVKMIYIHDLLGDLCLKAAHKEKFLYVMKVSDVPWRGVDKQRRIIFKGIEEEELIPRFSFDTTTESASLTRSLLIQGGHLSFNLPLLRVLNLVDGDLQDVTFKQVNLRHICLRYVYRFEQNPRPRKLPPSITLLWNLQTLTIRGSKEVVAPPEIWEMLQLRHLEIHKLYLPLPEPCSSDGQGDVFVLRNLQTLKTAWNLRLSEEVCKRMPNIKRLEMEIKHHNSSGVEFEEIYSYDCYCLYNIVRLNKLESLTFTFQQVPELGDYINNLTFPSSLKRLTLWNCYLQWEDMTLIGSLPSLEVLKLKDDSWSLMGSDWGPIEGEFLRLKYLRICHNNLMYWNADSSHFLVLEKLVLDDLHELDEIPSGIGDIPTLRNISVDECSESVANSAMKILEEQESMGNEDLQVQIGFFFEEDLEEWRGKVEQLEIFRSHNLRISAAVMARNRSRWD